LSFVLILLHCLNYQSDYLFSTPLGNLRIDFVNIQRSGRKFLVAIEPLQGAGGGDSDIPTHRKFKIKVETGLEFTVRGSGARHKAQGAG